MRCATAPIRRISASTRRSAGSRRCKPERAILTNLHTDLDYETLLKRLPEHIMPAYDGMRVEGFDT